MIQEIGLYELNGRVRILVLRIYMQKYKMADRPGESNKVLIQSLKENAKNKNTQQSTNNWIKV